MGARGPKPGFKLAKLEGAATPLSSIEPLDAIAAEPSAAPVRAAVAPLSAEDQENPHRLSGAALRELAHKHGMAKSEIADMDEVKLREQMQRHTVRRYEDAEVA